MYTFTYHVYMFLNIISCVHDIMIVKLLTWYISCLNEFLSCWQDMFACKHDINLQHLIHIMCLCSLIFYHVLMIWCSWNRWHNKYHVTIDSYRVTMICLHVPIICSHELQDHFTWSCTTKFLTHAMIHIMKIVQCPPIHDTMSCVNVNGSEFFLCVFTTHVVSLQRVASHRNP